MNQEAIDACRAELNSLAAAYSVPDLMGPQSTFIFLLESPHILELQFRVPVAGPSGASMTQHLFGARFDKRPLGRLLAEHLARPLDPVLDRIGLMNVCQIPMQMSAYGDPAFVQSHAEVLRALEGLRIANSRTTYADERWTIVQERLVLRLRRKLVRLPSGVRVIPCGRFAQKFFRLAAAEMTQVPDVIPDIPHPSYNNWSKPAYARAVNHMVNVFQKGG